MVTMLTSNAVDCELGQVNPNFINLVLSESLLGIQHYLYNKN